MIVKNESSIIERCLESVKDIVSHVCITDTGSNDNTVEIIENWILNGRGSVFHEEWKDFGYNRSISFLNAQKYIVENNIENAYILLIDADMKLVIYPDFLKEFEEKNADEYTICQKNPNISWTNTRIIKASLPWRCVGRTHEYWEADGKSTTAHLDNIFINDIGDGGCKQNKFERDIELLLLDLKEFNNPRTLFYLGESYYNFSKKQLAIPYYKKRIEVGGWIEEIWYSLYRLVCISLDIFTETNNNQYLKDAMLYANECIVKYPRAEISYKISSYFREKGEYNLSYFYACGGLALSEMDDPLFKDHNISYNLLEEISISAYYVAQLYGKNKSKILKRGEKACNKLIFSYISENRRQKAYQNLLFYVRQLEVESEEVLKFNINQLPLLKDATNDQFFQSRNGLFRNMNTSICRMNDKYYAIVRCVNYDMQGNFYITYDKDDNIRTKNMLIVYDSNFKMLSLDIIKNKLEYSNYTPQSFSVKGYEDCRIFSHKGELWMTACIRETEKGIPRIVLSLLSGNLIIKRWLLESPVSKTTCEKNWIPYSDGKDIFIIYDYSYKIYKVDFGNMQLLEHYNKCLNLNLSNLRGSAKSSDLLITHEVIIDNGQRVYLHRFIMLKSSIPYKISRPFYFKQKGVEYCMGITLHNNKIIMYTSINDACTIKYTMNKDQLDSMFSY
jgi:hypothetical protein